MRARCAKMLGRMQRFNSANLLNCTPPPSPPPLPRVPSGSPDFLPGWKMLEWAGRGGGGKGVEKGWQLIKRKTAFHVLRTPYSIRIAIGMDVSQH